MPSGGSPVASIPVSSRSAEIAPRDDAGFDLRDGGLRTVLTFEHLDAAEPAIVGRRDAAKRACRQAQGATTGCRSRRVRAPSPIGWRRTTKWRSATTAPGTTDQRSSLLSLTGPFTAANLRVCSEGSDHRRNCGREKYVRTISNFRALGSALPDCFDDDVRDRQIRSVQLGSRSVVGEMEEVPLEARRNVIEASWTKAVESCHRRNELRSTRAYDPLRRVRRGLRRIDWRRRCSA